MSAKERVVLKNYEYVPPDGGWGYMIWISAIIIYSTTSMFLGCFGVIFKNLMIELDMGSTLVTFMGGINAVGVAMGGFFTGSMLKLIGLRNLGLLAAFLFNVGSVWTIFVNSTWAFFMSQLIQYIGFGFLYSLACSQINDYFARKRLLAISFVQTISAVAAMTAPQIVYWSMDYFGYHGTLILIAGTSMQQFVAVILMQPVDKHLVRVKVTGKSEEMKLLVPEKRNDKATTPIITLTDSQRSFDAKNASKASQEKIDVEENKISNVKKPGIVDLALIKKFAISASSMGPTVSLFVEFLFWLMVPQALYSEKWSEDAVARALTLGCLGDLVTRVCFILLSNWLRKIGSHEIYIIGLLIALISRLGMLWSENRTIILVFFTIMGISRCTISVLPPLIFADSYTPEQFTSVIGINLMFVGLFNLVLGPAVGAIRDLTNSFPTVFFILTSCYGVVILLWCIELIYKRNKHKRKLQQELAAKLKKQKNKGKM